MLYCKDMIVKESVGSVNIYSFNNFYASLLNSPFVIRCFHFEIKHRGSHAVEDRSNPYTTQKPNLLTGGTDKLFLGPRQGAVADVIEPLNRDYPRVIGCGDTLHCFHLGLSLQLLLSLHPCSHISF